MKNSVMSKLFKLSVISLSIVSIPMSGYAQSSNGIGNGHELQQTLSVASKKQEFAFVAEKCQEHNLPKALAVIPVIESSYNSSEVSHVGAAGLWQLMPDTAKEYGISKQQRFQMAPSTDAALNYFNALHRQFGNWDLAVAAYNAGQGRVLQALHKNPSATSVAQLNLPLETKQYVQKFDRLQAQLATYSA